MENSIEVVYGTLAAKRWTERPERICAFCGLPITDRKIWCCDDKMMHPDCIDRELDTLTFEERAELAGYELVDEDDL